MEQPDGRRFEIRYIPDVSGDRAGPNGSGKSTIIKKFAVDGIDNLLDTDAIAKGSNPGNPLQAALPAGREVIERTRLYIASSRASFWRQRYPETRQ